YTNYEEGIYVGYRYFDTFNKQVSYPFGFGLSYTTFEYEVVESGIKNGVCEVKVNIRNAGSKAGKEVVELYVKAPVIELEKPEKELKAFAKTKLLKSGENEIITLKWNVMDMASFNEKSSSWDLAKGNYQWLVAASSDEVKCKIDQKINKAQKVKVNNVLKPEKPINISPMVKK
ncbi:MAG: fibronectin type III-like domain-contianing protein, partial [Tannerellaceae bacterium]|nr:fibronectin type III-like domain-contianing protein [Tannerellaceae bacterium]